MGRFDRRRFLARALAAAGATAAALAFTERPKQMRVEFPTRVAFYYPWFPETTFGRYTPTLGFYDSGDVAAQHVSWLARARVRLGVASWWGADTHSEADRLPKLLEASRHTRVGWTVYYEHGDAGSDQIANDLAYLSRYVDHPRWAFCDGKPVIFIYNTSGGETISDRWASVAGDWYYVPKLFSGWRDVSPQPPSWHQYGPSTAIQTHLPFSSAISPGFWKNGESSPRLARDPARFEEDVKEQVASKANWQIVTTFNEYGEGTAFEPTTEWGETYLDILSRYPYRSAA